MLQQLRGFKARKSAIDIETDKVEKDLIPTAPDSELTESGFSFTSQGRAADDFLVISVHEARNLVAKDYDTHSSDPFVEITLGACSKKTRVIYRNCHPLWEQKLVFPIAGVPEGEPLLVELFDKDFRAKEFLGQVVMTLGKALEIAGDPVMGQQYWFSVSKQRSTDIVGGELCLGFQVIDAVTYANLAEELESQMDGEQIAASLSGKALHVQLKGLNGLRASGLLNNSKSGAVPTGLSLFIKFGRLVMEKPLPPLPPEQEGGGSVSSIDGYELPVNEEVAIALDAALRTAPLAARRKDELYDVKFYLKSSDSNTTIAKTQIPIWDIPTEQKNSANSSPAAATAPGNPSTAVPAAADFCSTRGSTPETPRGMLDTSGFGRFAGAVGAQLGLQLRGAGGYSDSAPSTPRGTRASCTGDFTLASYRGNGNSTSASPRSALQQSGNLDDMMQRSRSDMANLVNSNSYPHNLSQLGTASGSNSINSAKGGFIEGSLSSVTYGKVQGPAGPAAFGKKKVHNLGEINNRAFKNILTPAKEVSRMGWVPTKSQCDDYAPDVQVPDGGCKHYSRIMEGYVPMYANLEIGLGLELVSQTTTAAADGAASTMPAGDVTVDYSDDEDSPDATPIALPEPYDLVLQDLTVQTGVNQLHSLLLGSKSELMAAHWASEGLLDMQVGPWQLGPPGGEYLRSRQVSYIKKLNIPVPLAPKQCQVWEEHRLLVKQDGGFVAQLICTNNAPKGDCFKALIQLCGVYINSNSSRLRISLKLDWHKNTLGKGMVQTGAEADSKRGWGNLVNALQQHVSSRGSTEAWAKPAEPAAAAAARPSATAATSCGGLGLTDVASWDSKKHAVLVVGVLLLVLGLLAVVLLVMGIWGVVNELQQLNAVLKIMSDAGKAQACSEL